VLISRDQPSIASTSVRLNSSPPALCRRAAGSSWPRCSIMASVITLHWFSFSPSPMVSCALASYSVPSKPFSIELPSPSTTPLRNWSP